MRVYIDADACPVVDITVRLAHKYNVPVVLYCDSAHLFADVQAEVRTVGTGADAADFALTAACRRGDLVVTQDYGVAAMVLGKGAYAIHQSGMRYTDDNIDALLLERHMAKKARMSGARRHGKGPARRTAQDDERFAAALESLLQECLAKEKAGE